MHLHHALLGCLLSTYIIVWMSKSCSKCCTVICMSLELVAFIGVGLSLLFVCLTQITKMDPMSRLCVTIYLAMQTACCFFALITSIMGRRGCEWLFDKMEMILDRIQELIVRFVEQNWKHLLVSVLLFINVQIFECVSTSMDIYQIVSDLLNREIILHRSAHETNDLVQTVPAELWW
jgi:hypothetical protein